MLRNVVQVRVAIATTFTRHLPSPGVGGGVVVCGLAVVVVEVLCLRKSSQMSPPPRGDLSGARQTVVDEATASHSSSVE